MTGKEFIGRARELLPSVRARARMRCTTRVNCNGCIVTWTLPVITPLSISTRSLSCTDA